MGAKVSAEMKHALFLVLQEGKAVKASARIAGVDASSLYKALRRVQGSAGHHDAHNKRAVAASTFALRTRAVSSQSDAWP